MKLRFWGVRGSIATPGESYTRYGGNTCCIAIEDSGGELLILDAGTGFCQLSDLLWEGTFGRGEGSLTVLLSQTYWDRLLGFPFASIVHRPGNRLTIYGPSRPGLSVGQIYDLVLAPVYSPFFQVANMGATHMFHEINTLPFQVGRVQVRANALLTDGQNIWGYRIEDQGRSICYLADVAYGNGQPTTTAIALAANADILIHGTSAARPDGQSEAPERCIEQAISIALEANIQRLVLSHYAPGHTDEQIDQLLCYYRTKLAAQKVKLQLDAAYEGLVIEV